MQLPMVAPDLLREVEQFLYHEPRLLDERRVHDWMELFSEAVHYGMPTRSSRYLNDLEHELSKPGELAWFDDDLIVLRGRVARLDTGMAWAEDPPRARRG